MYEDLDKELRECPMLEYLLKREIVLNAINEIQSAIHNGKIPKYPSEFLTEVFIRWELEDVFRQQNILTVDVLYNLRNIVINCFARIIENDPMFGAGCVEQLNNSLRVVDDIRKGFMIRRLNDEKV
jgi:hypothetical protein